MAEFFIVANSFAAPFCSDQDTSYIDARTPEGALIGFAESYKHPFGLYAAMCYASADAWHKKERPLAEWLSNYAAEKHRLTKNLGTHSFSSNGREFCIDGKWHAVADPKSGRVMPSEP